MARKKPAKKTPKLCPDANEIAYRVMLGYRAGSEDYPRGGPEES